MARLWQEVVAQEKDQKPYIFNVLANTDQTVSEMRLLQGCGNFLYFRKSKQVDLKSLTLNLRFLSRPERGCH